MFDLLGKSIASCGHPLSPWHKLLPGGGVIAMSKAGGGQTCFRCQKTVYFAEQVIGPNSNKYHKTCFKCIKCNKNVDSTSSADKDGELFCKTCHSKLFGPKGYGFGGGAAFLNNELAPVNSREELKSQTSLNASKTSLDRPHESKPKLALGGGDKCVRCGMTVYFAEQAIGPGNSKYHKSCFKCVDCNKTVDSTTAADSEGQLYCKSCHAKKFGPKGFGFGNGASFLTT